MDTLQPRAAGAYAVDGTGRQNVDLTMGLGSLLFGHRCSEVTDAIRRQLECSGHLNENAAALERWISSIVSLVPCAERVVPTASATEASMLALRVARAATSREWIVRLGGHYHGCFDEALTSTAASGAAGLHPLAASRVLLIDAADADHLADYLQTARVAAIILEPGGGACGLLPAQPDLAWLRQLTHETGTVLVFDESVSCFRNAPGGVQELAGVTPDLCVLSKILTGGLPGGALAGSAELLGRVADDRSASANGAGVTYASTFAGHPLTAAAGHASLELARSGSPQRLATANAEAVSSVLNSVAAEVGVDWRTFTSASVLHHVVGMVRREVESVPSAETYRLARANWAIQVRVAAAFADHGVVLHPLHAWISTAHDEQVQDALKQRARQALRAVLRDVTQADHD
jgi:glutamate-1-semialdehyde 2,1-aminomutase